jgi:Xaa-Pro aminopeptidase
MKSDLDAIMQQRDLDALLVTGSAAHNPDLAYLIGGSVNLTNADVVKVRGHAPVLFHRSMEREEAARTGLATIDYSFFDWQKLMKKAKGDSILAQALRYQLMLEQVGFKQGRVGLAGKTHVGESFGVFNQLQKLMPAISLVGEAAEDNTLLLARATKDADEIEHIRHMGKVTTTVVGKVADALSSHRVKDGMLVKSDGEALTIGDIKRSINLWIAEAGAENPESTIFSIGHDSAVPHSTGTEGDPLRLGQTIVFDIFPCEAGGGYYYDFTRTWCLGYAPDKVLSVYSDVRTVFEEMRAEIHGGVQCRTLQERTCDLFEKRGHPSVKSDPTTFNGYVHSLGHGLGLNIHEAPWYRSTQGMDDTLQPGMVTTIEPGLYYPDEGIGVRLEDTVYIRADGSGEILAPYPYDLILPVRQS